MFGSNNRNCVSRFSRKDLSQDSGASISILRWISPSPKPQPPLPKDQASLQAWCRGEASLLTAISVITFWANSVSSLVCAAIAANCLRAGAIDSLIYSEPCACRLNAAVRDHTIQFIGLEF